MKPSTRFSGLALAATVLTSPALVWADYGDGQHMMWGDGAMSGLFGIFMIFIMVALIAGVVALVWRAVNSGKSGASSGDTALSILEERFAKGEIDRSEYEERRRVLDA